MDRDERENVLTAASRKRLLDTLARILRILRIHEKEKKRENNAIRLTWLRVSSLLRDGHRNERHTTSALPPDPLTRSTPFRVKIVCLVLVVRRRRRSSIRAHHSRGGKHDFNEGESVLSREKSKRRQEFSRLSRGSHETRKQSMRKGGKFFVFWLPRFNTFSPKFLDKKKQETQKERRRPTKWREREREILLILLVGVFSFVGRMFLSFLFRESCLFFDVVCSRAALRVQKRVVY